MSTRDAESPRVEVSASDLAQVPPIERSMSEKDMPVLKPKSRGSIVREIHAQMAAKDGNFSLAMTPVPPNKSLDPLISPRYAHNIVTPEERLKKRASAYSVSFENMQAMRPVDSRAPSKSASEISSVSSKSIKKKTMKIGGRVIPPLLVEIVNEQKRKGQYSKRGDDDDHGVNEQGSMSAPLTYDLMEMRKDGINFRKKLWEFHHREPPQPPGVISSGPASQAVQDPNKFMESPANQNAEAESQRHGIELEIVNSTQSVLDRLHGRLDELKRVYNIMKQRAEGKSRKLDEMFDEYMGMQKKDTDDLELVDSIPLLEKVQEAAYEAADNVEEERKYTKTLRHMLNRARFERRKWPYLIDKMTDELKGREQAYDQMMIIINKLDAANRLVLGDKQKYQDMVQKEQEMRAKKLADTMELMEGTWMLNRYMDRREGDRKELKKRFFNSTADEEEVRTVASTFRQFMKSQKEDELERKMVLYEEAFRKIKVATGINNLNDVVDKYFSLDMTNADLVAASTESQQKIEDLSSQKTQLQQELEHLYYHESNTKQWTSNMDKVEADLGKSEMLMIKRRNDADILQVNVMSISASIERIATNLKIDKYQPKEEELDDWTIADDLNYLLERIETVNLEYLMNSDDGVTKRDMLNAQGSLYNLSNYNVRIILKSDGEESDEEDLPTKPKGHRGHGMRASYED